MQASSVAPRPAGLDRAAAILAGALILGLSVAVVLALGASSYTRIQQHYPGALTALASGVLRAVTTAAGALTLGALATECFVAAGRGPERMLVRASRSLDLALGAAIVWCVAAVAAVPVDATQSEGLPLSVLGTPGAFLTLMAGSYLPWAWVVVAVLALVVALVVFLARHWSALVVAAALAAIAVLAPPLTTQLLVGPDHDFGGDASMFGLPALAVLAGASVAVALEPGRRQDAVFRRRFRVLVVGTAAVALLADAVVIPFELAGGFILGTQTGVLFTVEVIAVVLGAAALWPRRALGGAGGASPTSGAWLRCAGILALAIALTAQVARTRIPPPQYFVPSTVAQNYFGYNVTVDPTFANLLGQWRLNILFAVISAVFVAVYLLAALRLRRRGEHWPLGRTIAWVLGWVVVFFTTSSGYGRYSSASFSVHMVLHMSLNMLAPVLLVLGGFVTLLLRATREAAPGGVAGPHEWISELANSALLRRVANPLSVFVVFVGSYWVLYFTPLFQDALRYHWAHQALDIEFVAVGYLFYGLTIGIDQHLRPLPYIGKLGLTLAAMPFHAFFGVVVMSQTTVIAELFYSYLNEPWMTNLRGDQYLGGGIAWAAGELPLAMVVIALVTQWARQDARVARRDDRALDTGLDPSFEDYNAMLARLSAGEPKQPGAEA